MARNLVITLDADTTERYLEAASQRLKGEIDEDCEPSGIRLTVEIGAIPEHGTTVYYQSVELGDATTELLDA